MHAPLALCSPSCLRALSDRCYGVLVDQRCARKRERIDDATSMHLTVGREENIAEQTRCSAMFSSDTDRKAS